MFNPFKMPAFVLCVLITCLLPVRTGLAQTSNQVHEIERIKDWVVLCATEVIEPGQCYIAQKINIRDTGQRLLTVIAGNIGMDNSRLLFFSMPLGIYLPAGMAFNIDGGNERMLQVHTCVADGCNANINLDDEMLESLKKGQQIKVAFLDAGNQKQITVDVSLQGFRNAFDSLK